MFYSKPNLAAVARREASLLAAAQQQGWQEFMSMNQAIFRKLSNEQYAIVQAAWMHGFATGGEHEINRSDGKK